MSRACPLLTLHILYNKKVILALKPSKKSFALEEAVFCFQTITDGELGPAPA